MKSILVKHGYLIIYVTYGNLHLEAMCEGVLRNIHPVQI